MSDTRDIRDIRDIRDTSSLNRIGDDCFRLILQYSQIQTMVTAHLISRRACRVINHITCKYLPLIILNLNYINLCQNYVQPRILTIIPQLRLDGYDQFSAIRFSKYLRTLDLSYNNLDAEGMQILASYFASCPQLQTLDLDGNNLGLEGMRVLAPHLSSLPCLQTLSIQDSNLDADGMRVLAPHLSSLPCLQTLYLGWNELGNEGMKVLVPYLATCSRLQTLDLSINYISATEIENIRSKYPQIRIVE